jgi:hypothetical protein
MLYDGKPSKISAEPLSTAEWIRVADLLELPPTAREDFERLRTSYQNILREAIELLDTVLILHRVVTTTLPVGFSVTIKGRVYIPVENLRRYMEVDNAFNALSLEDRESCWCAVDAIQEIWSAIETTDKLIMRRLRRITVTDLAKLVMRHTPNRPNHGDRWVAALTEACAVIDPTITKWMVREALHPRRKRKSS